MKPTTLALLTLLSLPSSSFGATTYTNQLLVNFNGSLAGAAYTLGSGEVDTTGTFKANGTPTISLGKAALDGGTSNDGFDFNPTTLGALTTQNWVAEAIVSFDAFETGQRTLIDVQGDTDFRINDTANGLEANFWDGAPANPNITNPLPGTGSSAHYALVWNAATNELTAYINGLSIGSTSGSGAFNTPDVNNVSFGYLGRSGFVGRAIDGSLDAVAFATFTGTFDPSTDLQLFTPPEYAYWDIDGATPGSGGAIPDGNWGDANWSDSPAGDAITTSWIDGSNAAFSAGSDATGPFEIELGPGTRQVGSLLVEEGDVSLNGGTLEVAADGVIETAPGGVLTISSALSTGDVEIAGDVLVSGVTTISGGLNVPSGQLLLDVPVTVGALSGSGIIDFAGNDFTAGGSVASTYSGTLRGTGSVTKAGAENLTFAGLASSFSGPLVVASGTLTTGPNAGNGINSYLGSVEGMRSISVQSDATLRLTQANVFGGGGKSASAIPFYQIDGGILRTGRFNIIGDTTLSNGATLTNASTETNPNYGGFQFLGIITTSGGTTPCEILDDGSTRPLHLLGGNTTEFSVGDLTASADADLIISSDLANGSGDYPGVGSLTKTGPGTLSLTGANTYTGTTTVEAGTLAVTGTALADSGSLVIDGGLVQSTGMETVDTLFFGSAQQASGTWGAAGSGAQHIDARFVGTAGVIDVQTGPSTGYSAWAGTFAGFTDTDSETDFEKDGLASGIEWVLGGNPTLNDAASIGPTFDNTSDPDDFLFVFRRSDLANDDANTTIEIEYGSDLDGWNPAENGVDGVSINVEDDVIATGIDRVTVAIPRNLNGGGKLFVRLKATVSQ